MQVTILIFPIVTVLGAATITTMVPYSELASADPDRKFKFWQSEDGQYGASFGCEKANDGCKQFK